VPHPVGANIQIAPGDLVAPTDVNNFKADTLTLPENLGHALNF